MEQVDGSVHKEVIEFFLDSIVLFKDGSMSGFNILCWAPVSRRPMAGIILWNLEGKMWSLMEGIRMVASRDSSCWWKTV